ncbi:hypothetical protein N172_11915 [Pantoea dispersa EGD-AAK13]|nr:hypothetical protein N172_11915 [Pantoea dispersa EGD-AAK13]KAF0855669.1 hypothetical protein Y788_11230 [Pantoea dispersa 625]
MTVTIRAFARGKTLISVMMFISKFEQDFADITLR